MLQRNFKSPVSQSINTEQFKASDVEVPGQELDFKCPNKVWLDPYLIQWTEQQTIGSEWVKRIILYGKEPRMI